MTKRRKSKNSETDDVKAYRHETETKKNVVPVILHPQNPESVNMPPISIT